MPRIGADEIDVHGKAFQHVCGDLAPRLQDRQILRDEAGDRLIGIAAVGATRQRIQMVLLREGGMTQPEIAAAMGVSLSTVNRAHMAYDRGGLKALEPKPVGGRKRENMTPAEEAALLAGLAKAAGAGEMLNVHD